MTEPRVTSYSPLPMSACDSVDLPEPFGPIERVHLAGADLEVDAAQDLVARHRRVQIGDAQDVLGGHGSTTNTSSPSTCTA